MIYMSDSNGNLIPIANDNQGNDGITMDLLWENSSPSSAFAAQTVTLNKNVNDYKYFIASFSGGAIIALLDNTNTVFQWQSTYRLILNRTVIINNNNTATFGPGRVTISEYREQNDQQIPFKIYGIK